MSNEVYCVDHPGADPAIVFIHGYCCDHTDWQSSVDRLSGRFRLIRFDLPGHGQTAASEPTVDALASTVTEQLVNMHQGPVVLVGHSMGTRVVIEMALAMKGQVSGVMFVDGSRGATSAADVEQVVASRTVEGFSDYVGGLFRKMFTAKADPGEVERVVLRAQNRDAAWSLALHNNVARYDAQRLPEALAENTAPLLVVQSTTRSITGERASLNPGESTGYTDFVRDTSGADRTEVQTVAQTGHFPQFEEPEQLAKLIGEFADTVSTSRGGN